MSNTLVCPVPQRARLFAGHGGSGLHRLRPPKDRFNPALPKCTVPYRPFRGLDTKGVHHDTY
ncbi:hypothetical protein F2Q69_00044695 [Brassica cretica]|uniref:Uncharacterized protein n=1 Tax=Brassica cretica TaxID=69181 RepID=A0A8S9NJQ2_BRACR|nr:hypothetical protein F2Q69_00044695 [Brassica cretica]